MLYNSTGDIAAEEEGNLHVILTVRVILEVMVVVFVLVMRLELMVKEMKLGMVCRGCKVQSLSALYSPQKNDGATTAVQGSLQGQRMGRGPQIA